MMASGSASSAAERLYAEMVLNRDDQEGMTGLLPAQEAALARSAASDNDLCTQACLLDSCQLPTVKWPRLSTARLAPVG